MTATASTGLLGRLGLHNRTLRAWALYDWAASSMQTTIMAAVFPIYFVRVASAGLPPGAGAQRLAIANTIATVLISLASPVLGALADVTPTKKRFLATFMLVGAVASGLLFFVGHGDVNVAAVLYAIAMVGMQGSMAFYAALLPHIAKPVEMDRVSTAGYAIGYLGGGLLLALNLFWIQRPELFGLPHGPGMTPEQATLPSRLAFLSVALWWIGFSIPLLRHVPEPPADRRARETTEGSLVVAPFRRIVGTLRSLRTHRDAFLLLLAFVIYNDGIQTIIKLAAAYGTEIGIEQGTLIAAILVVQFVGIPFAFAFGALASRLGAKRSVMLGLSVYFGIALFARWMTTGTHFLMLAALVAVVQGGTQALSRSLFATMIPAERSGEYFGIYGVFERFSGLFGPLVFAAAIQLTGTSRDGIGSVAIFFVVGIVLLSRVDVEAGRRRAGN